MRTAMVVRQNVLADRIIQEHSVMYPVDLLKVRTNPRT